MSNTFQVDLRGIVDLLSHHLYASPRVYVRELLQNAVDAITAVGPDHAGRVEITTGASLRITDNGIGLTEAQVHELLATIGRSSKRDELGFARHEFLGQFGIGLLSCFLVADEIRVHTRRAGETPVLWTGYSDGRYEVRAGDEREPGTTVTLLPRRGAEHYLTGTTVTELAELYGSLLPVEVRVDGRRVTAGTVPWALPGAERMAYAEKVLGFRPFDVIELNVPGAGLSGAAFVLPTPVNPANRGGHRVYLKRMLLSESVEGLLPDWAFFARCVVDSTELRPTASREALYDDGMLAETREAIADQLRGWLVRLAATDPRRLAQFLQIHHLGVKALALHDDEMLRLVEQWYPMQTTMGELTLAEFRARFGLLRYAGTADEFRQLAAVAAAQDVGLINGGYVYDADLIERLATVDPEIRAERLDPTDLTTRFTAVDPEAELRLRPFLAAAQRRLDKLGCEVVVRAFDPVTLPALYLVSRSAAFQEEFTASRDQADDLWGGVLDALAQTVPNDRPQLVLNHRNPLIRRVAALGDAELAALAVESLYGQALLLGHHPIRPADAALLTTSFLGLLDRAVPEEETR
ncbi:molecular chaperone HtpG [Actinoplanes octamycinicus]|uniref:Molecular chaperone HtpG n=1 Tax=Actinoplanes octamycinicus TaxID=135948 RepID=A0A7W7M5X7_9ACTN|nr:HSP90 family protein [Actinoplanes octamycinicus]MBB4738150.1 molecular chaperone HtpG [Actinoplanes octamycinicus]GIE59291.1 molecular chaperone HtpG [Actinoplanes octamycinicus]